MRTCICREGWGPSPSYVYSSPPERERKYLSKKPTMLEDTNSHAGSEIRYISTQKYLSNSRILDKWVVTEHDSAIASQCISLIYRDCKPEMVPSSKSGIVSDVSTIQ